MDMTLPVLLVTLVLLVAFLIVMVVIVKMRGSIGERKISEREVMAEITKEQFHTRRPL